MNNAIVILNVTQQPFISVGRFSGGCTINGTSYFYIPPHDAYIRKDWVKKHGASIKRGESWEQFLETVKAAEQ